MMQGLDNTNSCPRRSRQRSGSDTPERLSQTDRDSVIPGEDGEEELEGIRVVKMGGSGTGRQSLRSKNYVNQINAMKANLVNQVRSNIQSQAYRPPPSL